MCIAEDDLSCGPLLSLEDPDQFRKLRRCFWQTKGRMVSNDWQDQDIPFIPLNTLDGSSDLLRSAERVYLWLGTTLREQLVLAWVVSLFKALGIGTGAIQLLELRSPKPSTNRSIATLNGEKIRQTATWRQPAEEELACYESAWRAVSNPSPEELIAICATTSQFPAPLDAALRALLARYPDKLIGLNYWDRLILGSCRTTRRKSSMVIGSAMYAGFQAGTPDWPDHEYLFARLTGFSDAAEQPVEHPMVNFFGDPLSTDGELRMRSTEATIAKTGRSVLAGEANHVALNGIDDWVGGVHLKAHSGSPWLFDGQTLVPGNAA